MALGGCIPNLVLCVEVQEGSLYPYHYIYN